MVVQAGLLVCHFVVPLCYIRSQYLTIGQSGGFCLLEHRVSVALRWIVHIRVVEEILDSEDNLGGENQLREVEPVSPVLTCLMVSPGFHDFSSSRMDRQTVPDGYTFGWNRGGSNLPARAKEIHSH